MGATEVRPATAEMRRATHMHAAAAHRMGSAAPAEMRRAAATAMTSASASAASSRTRVSRARERGHEGNSGKGLESRDFGFRNVRFYHGTLTRPPSENRLCARIGRMPG
jgi:hypothetical protein